MLWCCGRMVLISFKSRYVGYMLTHGCANVSLELQPLCHLSFTDSRVNYFKREVGREVAGLADRRAGTMKEQRVRRRVSFYFKGLNTPHSVRIKKLFIHKVNGLTGSPF